MVAHLGMKIRHAIITVDFLEKLRQGAENEKLALISKAYEVLLTKEELVAVIQYMFEGEAEKEHKNLNEKTSEELLTIIDDQYYILCWMIDEVFGDYAL